MLDLSDGLHSLGSIRWQLLLAFTAAWVIVYICISKGIKSSGKVSKRGLAKKSPEPAPQRAIIDFKSNLMLDKVRCRNHQRGCVLGSRDTIILTAMWSEINKIQHFSPNRRCTLQPPFLMFYSSFYLFAG